jgi:hypothetical protein
VLVNKTGLEIRKFLPSFGAEFCAFQFDTQIIKMYTNAVLPVVLYDCETWSRTFKEERTMTEIESSELRNVFWPKKRG